MNRGLRRAHTIVIPLLAGMSAMLGIVAIVVRPERATLSGDLPPAIESFARSEPSVRGEGVAERSTDGLTLAIERVANENRLRVVADPGFAISDCLVYASAAESVAAAGRPSFERARLLGTVRPGFDQSFALLDDETAAFAYGLIERETVLAVEIPKVQGPR